MPTLRFSPYAWAKLLLWCDRGETEIGAFGISAKDDLLLVEDVHLVRQTCDWASVQFDDRAVADFFDAQVDAGRRPEEFGRIWIHTHPGHSPEPSQTDEETFEGAFGACDWSVMFILARGGATYGRLQFGVGPGGSLVLPAAVAYDVEFPATDRAAWEADYVACVHPMIGEVDRPMYREEEVEAAERRAGDAGLDGFGSRRRRPRELEDAADDLLWRGGLWEDVVEDNDVADQLDEEVAARVRHEEGDYGW